jgi:hypothetical protein
LRAEAGREEEERKGNAGGAEKKRRKRDDGRKVYTRIGKKAEGISEGSSFE